eukprot:CAMPEP_0172371954 /NCGR_PEP_ID=MMETSP1060-20121228/45377_1 /TAXON_ID=37318 /ORGANISM="Pseudo-nitzschia pungens, Strain cf. cingulata" /LENGTH=78 /DNA_ID=CAMNT_0013097729 /DNA_START=372 /DNA_END=608 /DNA_ORIENTATION=+
MNNPSAFFSSLSGSSFTTFFLTFNSVANDEEGKDSGVVNELEGNEDVDRLFFVTLGPAWNDSTPLIEMRRMHNNGIIA